MSKDFWTPERVKRLAENSHLSASRAAKKIGDGCTRNAVIGKRNRLKGIVFPSDAARGLRTPQERAAYTAERRKRDHAIAQAFQRGQNRSVIASAHGLSLSGVYQVMARAT